jgi:hypothetical protein
VKDIDPQDVVRSVRAADKKGESDDQGEVQPPEVPAEAQWQQKLHFILTQKLTPAAFERLVQRLHRESGFTQVEVTGRSGDGGIDGRGIARINGLMSFHVLFQCKKYKGTVSASEIRDLIALIGAGLLIPQVLLVPLLQRRLNVLIEERLSHLRELGEQIASGSAGDDDQSHERIHQIFSNRMRFFAWKFLMKGLLNLLNQLAPLGVLLWAGWLVIEGETTVGVVVAFISGFERMAGPVRGLLSVYRTAKHASVQHRLIAEWM